MRFDKTTCIAKGIENKGKSEVKWEVSPPTHFYGFAKQDPKYMFDDKRFASLKMHLGEAGYPLNAREAMALCFVARKP